MTIKSSSLLPFTVTTPSYYFFVHCLKCWWCCGNKTILLTMSHSCKKTIRFQTLNSSKTYLLSVCLVECSSNLRNWSAIHRLPSIIHHPSSVKADRVRETTMLTKWVWALDSSLDIAFSTASKFVGQASQDSSVRMDPERYDMNWPSLPGNPWWGR